MDKNFFGKELKNLRIEKAHIGLRNFADLLDMSLAELCDIEHGWSPPPNNLEWFRKLSERLGLNAEEDEQLFFLWKQPFFMQKMKAGIPILMGKANGQLATKKDYKRSHDYLQKVAKEHNKKADKYNRENHRDIK